MPELTPFSYFELLEACAQPGCPVCRVEEDIVRSYLHGIIRDCVVDPDFDKAFQKSGGFCREHAWMMTQEKDSPGLGVAILFRRTVGDALEMLSTRDPLRDVTAKKGKAARSGRSQDLWTGCLACRHRAELTDCVLATLLNMIAKHDGRMEEALRKSGGLCFPHMVRALEVAGSAAKAEPLAAKSRDQMRSLMAELDEFIRKHDYRFSTEAYGEERDSWLRAVARMVGEK